MLALACVSMFALPAAAMHIWSDEEAGQSLSLDATLKDSVLVSRSPDDVMLYPEPWTLVDLFRFRLGLNAAASPELDAKLAYELSARVLSDPQARAAGSLILPSSADAPFRVVQLSHTSNEDGQFFLGNELDRAYASYHPEWGELSVGRQAIGLGRGVLFGAVDMFAPFSPLEIDREWRRGVDAARFEYRFADTASTELLGAFGETWEESALLLRGRGYLGDVDGEVILGKRAEDLLIGGVVSMPLGGAEAHLEAAVFNTPEAQPDGGLFGYDHLVGKATVGSSYTIAVGNGLTVLGEYHYSGFGVEDPEDIVGRLLTPEFQERYLRGDTQILGQHALGLQATYPFNEAVSGGFLVVVNPVDGSGMASPSVRWDVSQTVTITAAGFAPWGQEPEDGQFHSEYGGSPVSVLLQVACYF
jgi:hypothetical protein